MEDSLISQELGKKLDRQEVGRKMEDAPGTNNRLEIGISAMC